MKNSNWGNDSIEKIKADYIRSSDTHLIKFNLPYFYQIDFYLKDETTHLVVV